MARLDIPVSDSVASLVRLSADAVGQSVSEYVRRRISIGFEPGPYRFTGLGGSSFIRDLVLV